MPKTYYVHSVFVDEFKSGPREGQRKPIKLPNDAVPLGVVSGFRLSVYYLVPADSKDVVDDA